MVNTSGPMAPVLAGWVGILSSQSFQGQIDQNQIITDHEGRILLVTVETNDTTFQLCNIYCPTDDTGRSKFLDNLPTYIKGSIHLIVGGDWNCVENPQMDKFGGNPHRGHCRFGTSLFPCLQTYGLVDVFRKHNLTVQSYTWFSPDSSIGVRIDRFYLRHNIFHTSK